jgi:hypothetical protein
MNTKTSKNKKLFVKSLKDEDTSSWYDSSKPLNLDQLIGLSKQKKAKAKVTRFK